MHATAFSPELLLPAITGHISDATWRRRIADRLARVIGPEDAVRAVTAWSESAGAVDAEVLALVTAARQRVSVHVVTNATSRLHDDLRRLGLDDAVDGVISSADVGIPKPELGIFAAALSTTGAAPSETLFVDDAPGHVAAAATLGIIGHVFVDVAGLRRELLRHGVLSGPAR
jgi:putative hydrolase of the HAD superfamily